MNAAWKIDAVGLGVCAGATALAYAAAVRPSLAARDRVAAMRVEAAGAAGEAQEAEAALAQARALGAQIERDLDGAVVLRPLAQMNSRLADVTRLAEACGLKVEEVTPAEPAPQTRFTTVSVRLAGVGTFASLAACAGALDRTYPDTAVTGFKITAQREEADEAARPAPDAPTRTRYELDLLWYAAPAPGTRKPAPAQGGK